MLFRIDIKKNENISNELLSAGHYGLRFFIYRLPTIDLNGLLLIPDRFLYIRWN